MNQSICLYLLCLIIASNALPYLNNPTQVGSKLDGQTDDNEEEELNELGQVLDGLEQMLDDINHCVVGDKIVQGK